MYLYMGELIDVQDGEFKSLIFKTTKYDYGLKTEVPTSYSIGIPNDFVTNIPNYKKHIGEMILVGVRPQMTKSKKSIFTWVQTDVLDPSTLLTSEF